MFLIHVSNAQPIVLNVQTVNLVLYVDLATICQIVNVYLAVCLISLWTIVIRARIAVQVVGVALKALLSAPRAKMVRCFLMLQPYAKVPVDKATTNQILIALNVRQLVSPVLAVAHIVRVADRISIYQTTIASF